MPVTCDLCTAIIPKRARCSACGATYCSQCMADHECEEGSSSEEEASPPPTPRDKRRKLTKPRKAFKFHLVVVHTSPSGGVRANALEIVSFIEREDKDRLPVIFAGDWYVPDDQSLSSYYEAVDWGSHLTDGGLTLTVPEDKTNLPGTGSGMIADYYILGPEFRGAASIVCNGSEKYDDFLYGWKRPFRDHSDHAPVRLAVRPAGATKKSSKEEGSTSKAKKAYAKASASEELEEEPATQSCGAPGFEPFDIITWNINHFGAAGGSGLAQKLAEAKQTRKAEAVRWMLQFNPTLMVLQEVNDVARLQKLAAVSSLGYKMKAGPLVNINKDSLYAPKEQEFKEYFPCIYDPKRCSVEVVGAWDGRENKLHRTDPVLYTSTRPAVVYEVTLRPGTLGDAWEVDEEEDDWTWGRIIPIAGDGHCLFAAIARGTNDRDDTDWTYTTLRQSIAARLGGRRDAVKVQMTAILNDLASLTHAKTLASEAIENDATGPKLTGVMRSAMIRAIIGSAKFTWGESSWTGKQVAAYRKCSGSKAKAPALRSEMVNHLERLLPDFGPGVDAILDAVGDQVGPTLRPFMRQAMLDRIADEDSDPDWSADAVNAYIADIRNTRMFGGELEIDVAGAVVGHQIEVYEPANGVRAVHEEEDDQAPIVLHYNGRDHYDLYANDAAPFRE